VEVQRLKGILERFDRGGIASRQIQVQSEVVGRVFFAKQKSKKVAGVTPSGSELDAPSKGEKAELGSVADRPNPKSADIVRTVSNRKKLSRNLLKLQASANRDGYP
jgi:hypothetical protein